MKDGKQKRKSLGKGALDRLRVIGKGEIVLLGMIKSIMENLLELLISIL